MTASALDRNEIWTRAHAFKERFRDAKDETAESQTFWLEFFNVFGQDFRALGTFEGKVKHQKGSKKTTREMDIFWPGTFLCEQKSRGKNLDEAMKQAQGYVDDLIREKRHQDVPRFMAVCDFARMVLWDRERDATIEFQLSELENYIDYFGFIAGYDVLPADPETEVNIRAAESMADLHDALVEGGYPEADLSRFLTRVMFILFAEDTGICGGEPAVFQRYLEKYTKSDGTGVGDALQRFFETFDRAPDKRSKRLPKELCGLEHVNGSLFAGRVDTADFTGDMREKLLACCAVNWEQIRPEIFGALFQGVMEPKERRQIGAHYTTRKNIRKVIDSLFLDDLKLELDKLTADRSTQKNKRLDAFLNKLAEMQFFDPACGCGNFLLVTYREIRKLETRALQERHGSQGVGHRSAQQQGMFAVAELNQVKVDQFFGIEIEGFPAEIARVALWLMDHLCNREMSQRLGQYFARFPLTESANIRTGNALRMDWREVVAPGPDVYVFGNPPFVGQVTRSDEQTRDLKAVWGSGYGRWLDYVSAWILLASRYSANSATRIAFVTTNSVTQGEQVPLIWSTIQSNGTEIDFAHRTFPWTSDARGKAHVHCVIIGMSDNKTKTTKKIFDKDGRWQSADIIGPYLNNGTQLIVERRAAPFSSLLSEAIYGNKPSDGGNLILEENDDSTADPIAKKYIRSFVGARELLSGHYRKCLWLVDASPKELRSSKFIRERIESVRDFRSKSSAKDTKSKADSPHLFFRTPQPSTTFVAIPRVVSERRRWLTVERLSSNVIASDALFTVIDASGFVLSMLSSSMFIAWFKVVGGRLKSDLRFSERVVYNTFPLQDPTAKQCEAIIAGGQAVLDARAAHPDSSLADLYDPLAMPANLLKAHKALDKAVDRAYRKEAFADDDARVKHLFELYEELTTETK